MGFLGVRASLKLSVQLDKSSIYCCDGYSSSFTEAYLRSDESSGNLPQFGRPYVTLVLGRIPVRLLLPV